MVKSDFPVHAARFAANSEALAESHRIPDRDLLIPRLKIAFTAPPKKALRGRPPGSSTDPTQPSTKKRRTGPKQYRAYRTHDAYAKALSYGSNFFLLFIYSFPQIDATTEAIQTLIEANKLAVAYRFSLDVETRHWLATLAEKEGYDKNERFNQFVNGLQWNEGLLNTQLPINMANSSGMAFRMLEDLIRDRGLETDQTILTAMAMLFPQTTQHAEATTQVEQQTQSYAPQTRAGQKEQQAQDGTNTDKEGGYWNMLRFHNAPIENLHLIRCPDFWDIVDRGVQNSNALQVDRQRKEERTACITIFQRKGKEDGIVMINLEAHEIQNMRMLLEMTDGEETCIHDPPGLHV